VKLTTITTISTLQLENKRKQEQFLEFLQNPTTMINRQIQMVTSANIGTAVM
jgi:hypothetical protein